MRGKETILHRLLAVLVICAVLSAGCAPLATPTSKPTRTPLPTPVFDLLADNTCAKPCVLGITPGNTTVTEAWTILKDKQLPLGCLLEDRSSPDQQYWDRRIECDSGYSDRMFVESGIFSGVVESITINVSNMTLEQLISKYGPPDAVEMTFEPASQDTPPGPPIAMATLIYEKIKALVRLDDMQGTQFVTKPNTRVSQIVFLKGVSAYAPLDIPWHGYSAYGP